METNLTVSGLHINKYQSLIEHCDQVGPTTGEGLVPALCRVHARNGYKDEQVRHEDYQNTGNQVKS